MASSTRRSGSSAVMYQSPPTRLALEAGRYRATARSPGSWNGSSCSGRMARCSSSVTCRCWANSAVSLALLPRAAVGAAFAEFGDTGSDMTASGPARVRPGA